MIKSHLQKLLVLRAATVNFGLLLVCGLAWGQSPSWQAFAQADDRPRLSISQSTSLLVFMRAQEPRPASSRVLPTDILIDGRLHTALLPGGFSEATVCPGIVQLQVVGQATHGLQNKPSLTVSTSPGGITYIEVTAPTASQPLKAVSHTTDSAPQAMQGLRRQVHALSRLPAAQDCRVASEPESLVAAAPAPLAPLSAAAIQPQPVTKPPSTPEPEIKRKHTLSSEMLFRFGGSRVQDLTPQGHAEIVRIARVLKDQIRNIQTILVQGHTDPMGSAATNKRLSNERAETVRQILVNSGIPARKIQAEGLSASQLLVTDCRRLSDSKKNRQTCNAPNRRVEIITTSS